LSDVGASPNGFPKLPILQNAAPTRSQRERYGALLYLGIAGLLILAALLAWFAHGVWRLRDVWADVYVLHDASRTETERIHAAFQLGRNSRLSDSQLMETCLRRDLPDLARYLLAEAVSTEAVARDPRGYALTVARSPGWPDWLRLVLARRLAYGAARGYAVPSEALDELARHPDPMIGPWATCAAALSPGAQSGRTGQLEAAAGDPGERGQLAKLLLAAVAALPEEREQRLDQATIWLRQHHPQAAQIWRGWEIRDGQLIHEGENQHIPLTDF
jgi:hypothetical protein